MLHVLDLADAGLVTVSRRIGERGNGRPVAEGTRQLVGRQVLAERMRDGGGHPGQRHLVGRRAQRGADCRVIHADPGEPRVSVAVRTAGAQRAEHRQEHGVADRVSFEEGCNGPLERRNVRRDVDVHG